MPPELAGTGVPLELGALAVDVAVAVGVPVTDDVGCGLLPQASSVRLIRHSK